MALLRQSFLWIALLALGGTAYVRAQVPVKVNFQSGVATVSGQANSTTWQSVTFTRNFNGVVPVVIMGPAYSADGHPHAIRVRSVTATGFQWQIDEWDYLAGDHPGTITVHYFAITPGTYSLGSQLWQVGRLSTVNRTNSTITLTGFVDAPVVLTQVETTNNLIATNNPRALKTRISAVTAANFAVNLETQQSYTTAISNEGIGYVAVSGGIGYLDGKVLWADFPGTVSNTVKTFYTGPFTNPVVVAQTQTKNDVEPGDLRMASLPVLSSGATRVQFRFQEETSSNASLTHTAEQVAGLFIGDMPGEAAAKMVISSVAVTQTAPANWQKVNLTTAYTAPVVVFGPLSRNDGAPAAIRVRNVLAVDPTNANRASFEYQVDEWDFMDGVHAPETASYMVMEAGVYAIGGQVVQAGANTGVTNVGVTQYASSDYWSSDIFYEREPVIFAQCVTVNEASAVTARVDTVDTLFDYPMNFRLRLTEAENANQTHAAETVHYIIVPAGEGQFLSTNNSLRFFTGTSGLLSSTLAANPFAQKYADPFIFASPQGDVAATIDIDGYYGTAAATDLEPIVTRYTQLNAAGVNLVVDEDTSGSNNTHSAEASGWLVVQGTPDADGDGVSDAVEAQMGTNPNLATSPANASGGTASDWDTLQSLLSLTVTVGTQTGYERVDRKATTPVAAAATVRLSRSVGTMPLTLRVTPTAGSTDPTKGAPIGSDYNIAGISGGNITIPSGQGTTASPYTVTINPVQDGLLEVPEHLKLAFGPVPSGANPQIVNPSATVRILDADPANTNNRSMFVAYLSKGPGVISQGSGIAVALAEGDNDNAKVSLNFSGLSSLQVSAYLRINNDQDIRNNLGVGQLSDVVWNIRAAATKTTDQQMLDALNSGQIYLDINTSNYAAGEITGFFNAANGTPIFDPNRPDLVAPALPGTLTAAETERDIYRFIDQCTFGATTAIFNDIKASVEAVDGTISDGCTAANLITGYTNWLDKQMDLVQTPSPNFLTLVMAADNEEFVLRGAKPIQAGNDPQFAGAGFAASYDAYGNLTNPYNAGSNNANSFNSPQSAANRRREWWTMVLQSKDQVRQRMAAALQEIVVISENDTNVLNKHYGCANYWDMLAENAFGKYRTILEKVTYSPMMGIYLSHLRNRARYISGGVEIFPDENYAREIMQLFSIGLVLRHPDGSLVLAGTGLPIPTYDQTDITELARVMTGLTHGARHAAVTVRRISTQGIALVPSSVAASPQIEFQGVNFTDFNVSGGEAFYQAPWLYPMKALGRFNGITYHDFNPYVDPNGVVSTTISKRLLAGKAGQTDIPLVNIDGLSDIQTHPHADNEIKLALNALAGDPAASTYNGHQNTPALITRQLIQRLVTSNPSPGYIYRASQIYRNTNGNLGAVLKGILLDYEARSLSMADTIVSAGKLKEPLIHYASLFRSLTAKSNAPLSNLASMSVPFNGADSPMTAPYPTSELAKFPANASRLRLNDQTSVIGQSPQKAPSVFNWFLPDYVQPGIMATAGLYGPELQITTESSLINRINRSYALTWMNLGGGFPGFGLDDFVNNASNSAPRLLTDVTTLTFDATNWNIPQTVTVRGYENLNGDGLTSSSLLHTMASADANFGGGYTAPLSFGITDNDTGAAKLVSVSQSGGTTAVTEGTVTDTYTVVLTAQPTANVIVTPSAVLPWQTDALVNSPDVTLAPASLTFTTSNWNTPQTVTVTAVDNTAANSFLVANAPLNARVAVIRNAVSSTDAGYSGSKVSDFNCTLTDNDTPVRRFVPGKATATGIPVITEGSTTDNYTVAFASGAAPTANVTLTMTYDATRVDLTSTDGTFAKTPGVATLIFTPSNYTTARTVTLTAVNDTTYQGAQFKQITHTTASTDTAYNGLACAPLDYRVNDNDDGAANGVTIVQTWGDTSAVEGGTTDTYLVVLDKAPTGNVTLAWSGNNADVSGIGNLTFTTANWFVPQTVTLTATEDLGVETTRTSTIKYTVNSGGYSLVKTVAAIIGDNDLNSSAVVTLTQSGGTTAIAEGGATDTLDFKLSGQPNSNVTVTLNAAPIGQVANSVLTFTPSNWATTQTATIAATDDTVTEGAHSVVITSTVSSSDARYNNFVLPDVSAAITDNDNGSRIVIAATSGSTEVTEGSTGDTINVSLAGLVAPAANVVVTLASTGQVILSPTSLTFTSANWTVPQAVTVSANNDTTSEGLGADTITASTNASQPAGFISLSATTPVTVYDNDDLNNAGAIQIVPTNGFTRVVEGGMSDTFDVALRRAPTANVTLTASQLPASIASVSNSTLTFTPANWFIPQTVTVNGVDDALVQGAHSTVITYAANASGTYVPQDVGTVTVSVGENEAAQPSVNVSPTTGSVTEGSTTFTYNITLNAAPLAGATVRVTPSAYFANAATTAHVTFSPTSVDFTNATSGGTAWNRTATITVTAVDNTIAEPTVNVTVMNATTIVAGTDARYNGMVGNDVIVTVADNDTTVGRIAVTESGGNTIITEDSGTDTVDVALVGPAPAANVTVNLARSGSQFRFVVNGVAVDSASLTFTPANYTAAQTVTLIAIPDTGSEGIHSDTFNLTTTSSAPAGYVSLATAVPIRMLDSDDLARALISIVHSGGNTRIAEGGTTDSYSVVLRRAPTANVTLTGYYNPSQVTLSATDLVFTPTNWNSPQAVTVTAVDDTDVEGSHTSVVSYYASNTGGYVTTDTANTGTSLMIGDNDVAGTSLVNITESGGFTWLSEVNTPSDTYTVVLGSAPTANVTLTPQAYNALGGSNLVTFSPATLTFTPANYTTPQVVTVTLATSATNNSTRAVFIGHVVTSTDQSYANYTVPNVNAIVSDANDTTYGITALATGANTTVNEGTVGNTDSVYVFLRRAPSANVTVTPSISVAGQATFSPATLTFTSTNWNVPQLLTITSGVDTTVETSPHTATLTLTPNAAGGYAVTNTTTHTININDDDATGKLVITPASTTVQEGGLTTYTIQLSAAPTAPVTITIITEKHGRPASNHALQYGYYSNSAVGSNMQKDNFQFDWTELITAYNAAYTAARGATPESTATAPAGHLAGTKAVIDKLDLIWGGGQMKAKWPDGAPAADNPRQVIIDGIYNSYSLTRISTDATNFNNEVRDRCRFAAYLVSVAPTATVSH